jgi:hypothetical protein
LTVREATDKVGRGIVVRYEQLWLINKRHKSPTAAFRRYHNRSEKKETNG